MPVEQWLIQGADRNDPSDERGSKDINSDRESNYSSLSESSTKITTSKSVVELSVKRHFGKYRTFSPYYSSPRRMRRKAWNRFNHAYKGLDMRPKFSDKNVQASSDNYLCEEVGFDNSDAYACSIYITSKDSIALDVEAFVKIVKDIAKGRIRIRRTPSGILVAFTNEIDADHVIKLRLQHIFKIPVQLTRFRTGECKFSKIVVIKDLPWCISYADISKALELQGIQFGHIRKTSSSVSIEIRNALYVHKLIEEGLNFFNHVTFPAELQTIANQPPLGIVQCYKCQGFWHTAAKCRYAVRCVRCGENHDVTYCPRPRNSPTCCHCGEAHHAAHKLCPVRLKHVNSAYLAFQLARDRPPRSLSEDLRF